MNMTPDADQEFEGDLLDALSQEFVELWRAGKAPDVEQYAANHPDYESELKELLPAIIFAEQLNPQAAKPPVQQTEGRLTRLGAFELHREIGRGGMGIVYEATQAPFKQKFAVKVLLNRLISSTTLSHRFAREAQAASRLHHPNIVPARHYGTEDNHNFIVMPMVDGVSLDRLINGHPDVQPHMALLFDEICCDYLRVARLGAQVVSALSHAHQNGMVHRDIKPANLILDREANIWVTDFGLAKLYDEESDLSRTGELIGTPRYMAPEQLIGVADERSDIYGLGLTLYEMLAGQCPWQDKLESDTTTKRSRPVLEIPDLRKVAPAVPAPLAKVIMKACAHHPESRFQSARELEMELNDFCYQGRTDRRNSARTRADNRKTQARHVAVVLGVLSIVAVIGWMSNIGLVSPSVEQVAEAESEPVQLRPSTHCIVYNEPHSALINVEVAINHRADDAEEFHDGSMYLDSTDLELTWDETDQTIGLRFAGVEVPAQAKIYSAYIELWSERTDRAETQLQIYGLASPNPTRFTPVDEDLTSRERQPLSIEWQPDSWERGEQYATPDLSELVQAMVDHPEWKSGNAMGFVIDGKGDRTATAFDGNIHYGPLLKIQYQPENTVD